MATPFTQQQLSAAGVPNMYQPPVFKPPSPTYPVRDTGDFTTDPYQLVLNEQYFASKGGDKNLVSVPGVGMVPRGTYGTQPATQTQPAQAPISPSQPIGATQALNPQAPLPQAQAQAIENVESQATSTQGQKHQQTFQNLSQSGGQVPTSAGEARMAVAKAAPTQTVAEYKPTQTFMQYGYHIMQQFMMNAITQQQEIAQKGYTAQNLQVSFRNQLAQIDQKAINMKNIIEGTEDDIRAEIGKAGGFATESQVLALTNNRNKDLIRGYNNILQQRQSMEQQMQTQVQLASLDQQYAKDRYDSIMQLYSMQEKIQTFNQQTVQKQLDTFGAAGMAELYQNDPYSLGLAEQTLGIPSGSLSNPIIASILDAKSKKLDTSWQTIGGNKVLVDNQTGKIIKDAGPSGEGGLDAGPVGIVSGKPYTSKQFSYLERLNQNVSTNQTYQRTSGMRASVDNVITALEQETGVSDIAAINQFQKVIDDGAVTRDQDVTLLQSASSLKEQLDVKIAGLKSGEKLSDTQRTQMKELVQAIYAAQVNALTKDAYIQAKIIEAQTNGISIADSILGQVVPDSMVGSGPTVTIGGNKYEVGAIYSHGGKNYKTLPDGTFEEVK